MSPRRAAQPPEAVEAPEDEGSSVVRRRQRGGALPLGWCMTGHHEGRTDLPKGSMTCPGRTPAGGLPCSCSCHSQPEG